MKRVSQVLAAAIAACGLLSVPALAGGADQIRARVAGFRQLGAAYKSVNDGLRAGDLAKVRQASGQIGNTARGIYAWFPRGSAAAPGVKTLAKAEIWTRGAEFRAAADAFSRQAQAFQRAAASGNLDAIRGESRKLGATCKGCHDTFKLPAD